MGYKIDRKYLKTILTLRIIFLSLIFLMSTFTIVMGFFFLIDLVYIPIILSVIHIDLTVYLILSTIKLFKRQYREEYMVDDNIFSSSSYKINLKEVDSLKVYSTFGIINRIRIIEDDKKYNVSLLTDNGLYILIKTILEYKNE